MYTILIGSKRLTQEINQLTLDAMTVISVLQLTAKIFIAFNILYYDCATINNTGLQ